MLRPGLVIALWVAVALVYAPIVGHDFKNFDDDLYILGDPGLPCAGTITDNTNTADLQPMAAAEHGLSTFGVCCFQNGVSSLLIEEENAGVVISKGIRDQPGYQVQEGGHILDL